MKLHLPSALRKALLLALAAVSATLGIQTAAAAVLFDGVGLQTYADFGQNCGRYVAGEVNAMLQAIRDKDHGIAITYQSDGYKPYIISNEQGMIDFASASSNPVAAAVGYAYLATVSHNGIIAPTYSALEVGDQNAIRYNSIDFRRGKPFHMESLTDFKIARLNKIVTDVQPTEFYSGANPGAELNGQYLYRTGSGAMELALVDSDGIWRRTQVLELHYTFSTGGIVTIEWAEGTHKDETDGNFGIFHHVNPKVSEEIANNPLPYRVRSGDSGSPSWVYNTETKTYQYISAGQSGGQYFSQDRGDIIWSQNAMESCGVRAQLGGGGADHTISLNAVTHQEEKMSGVGDTVEVSTIPYSGTLSYTDAAGDSKSVKYIGIQKGKHTWKDLSAVKDKDNWFNYGEEYFNVAQYGPTEAKPDAFSFADMFVTDNLVFEAGDNGTYNIKLEDNVDLGIGYVQLSKAEGVDTASFNLTSEYLLDSAGFGIDEGVTLELNMKAPEERMVEWRKAGAGNLVLTGTRDTNALLNVGGSGTVTLAHTNDSYAAYNVLASSGSTLVVNDLKQVYRDVTLGAGGATLDLNGNDFTWNNSAKADGSGFKSLHLLVEKDVVTNNKAGSTITINIEDPGEEAFVGAFKDTENGAIKVEYNSDSEKTWVMNTVFTNLKNNKESSFTVKQGSVALQGINTVHGKQMLGRRVVNYFDWHYADATMDVVVERDAEFTLGSHARLTGDVTVKDGGTFTMTEYTTHQFEYLEGGVKQDDTYEFRKYFGLHGNVKLESENSMFKVAFSTENHFEATDSESLYQGIITGNGGMTVDTAGGSLRLTNASNSFKGRKSLEGGKLVAESLGALGDTSSNGWFIKERGVLVVENAGLNEILPKILDSYEETITGETKTYYSNGVLALTQDFESEDAPVLSNYQQLIIGAVGDIQFGKTGTQTALLANENNEWHLGGGGGNLVVNYKLDNEEGVLVLGNQYTTGTVTLTNPNNKFKRIDLVGGVTFVCDEHSLGGAEVALKYANRLMGSNTMIDSLTKDSDGAILLDNMHDVEVDLSSHSKLSLAASKKTVFSGTINLDDNDDTYYFGGGGGHLTLDTELTNGNNLTRNVVVDGQFCRPTYNGDGESNSEGEVIELKRVLQITGNLTLQGYDENRIPGDDPMYVLHNASIVTLQLSVDDALQNVDTVYMNDCAFIDINGTKQTFDSLVTPISFDTYTGAFGVVDYSDEQDGELVLNVASGEEEARWGDGMLWAYLGTPTITKTGDGELMLMNAVECKLFDIQEGTIIVTTNVALNSAGSIRVAEGALLDLSWMEGSLVNRSIELNGGTISVGEETISGSITAKSGESTIYAEGVTATLNATIGAEKGASLVLEGGEDGAFVLGSAQNNTQGGAIKLKADRLSLNNDAGVSIGGTLQVSQNAVLASSVAGVAHQIDCLDVASGADLTIDGNTRSAVWNIQALNGAGNVIWQSGSKGESCLVLNGEGALSGKLTVQGGATEQGAPGLVLSHDLAARAAEIDLEGASSMAVNTANAHIGGLSGDATGKVFAYKPAEEGSTPIQGATLTTTGSGRYEYKGSITATDGARLNLAMTGEGTQTYSGQVEAANVSALDGTLNLSGDSVDIAGDVTVARGAVLNIAKGITLESGQYLCSTGNSGAAGQLQGAVTFNGGSLRFDVEGLLNNNSAALQFGSTVTVSDGQKVVVDFFNTSNLTNGSVLQLTSGHTWTSDQLTAAGVDYLDASFSMQGDVLSVSFTQKEGNLIWDGTAQQQTWSSSKFGKGITVPSGTDTAVFNDSAESQTVQVSGSVTAKALLFDNSLAYTVDTANGTLTADQVKLEGSRDVTLGAGVSISQAAEIAKGSTLVLQADETLGESAKVTGNGTLAVDSDSGIRLDGKVGHIGSVELRRGTLSVGQTLSADDMVVNSGAELQANTGNILANNATLHSAGTITVEIGSSKTETLANAVAAGADGTAGTFVKEGAGTLSVSKSLVADTVRVNAGVLQTSNKDIVPGFLETTKRLEVGKNARAYIGGNAYTIPDRAVATEIVVNGGTLELAIAQNTTRTVAGNLTVKNGGKLQKVDGGLIFTGTTTLGASSQDQVTLAGNWGKSGTIFNGLVQGEGKVTLSKGNSVEKFTFNNGGNTFSGEIEATTDTQLVAGHKTALAEASVINLNGGTLVLAANEVDVKKLSGDGVLDINATAELPSATLNVEEGDFSGTVEANVSITKSGNGNFTLSGDTSKSSGTLTVKAGTLTLNTATLGTPETIVSGGTLALTSTVDTISGSLTVTNGATLKLVEQDAHAVYAGGLTLDSGAILDVTALNISAGQSDPITLMTGGNIAVPTNVTVNFGSSEPEYYALAVDNNSLLLTFTPPAPIQDLIWDHSSSTNWSTTEKNWHTAEAPATHVAFTENANVTFESSAGTAVLQEAITAGTMVLDNGANLTLNTNGHSLSVADLNAAGGSSLTKAGAGTATFGGADAEGVTLFTLTVNGGAVAFNEKVTVTGSDNAVQIPNNAGNVGDVEFNGGLVLQNGTVQTNKGNIKFGGESTVNALDIKNTAASVTVKENASLSILANMWMPLGDGIILEEGATLNMKGEISATGLAGGQSSLKRNDGSSSQYTIDSGAFTYSNVDITTKDGATIGNKLENSSLTSAHNVTLNNANNALKATTVTANKLTVSNTMQLGDITLTAGTLDLGAKVNATSLTMNGGTLVLDGTDWIASTGAIQLNGGTLDLTGMSITSGQDYTLATGTGVTLNSGVTFTLAQGLQDHYKLTANGTTLMLTFIQPAPSGALIWDGTANSHWSNSTEDRNWHMGSGQAGSSSFTEGADVHFASGPATVTLTANILAGDATFAAGAHVAISNGGEFEQQFSNVTIEEGASVSFDENCSTTITDTLALNGTVTNSGYLEIASGTVATDATGVLAGEGITYLLGKISNAGTVKLDHATLAGADEAAITGDVVINGGVLLGTMTLGSEDSTVSVTEAFTISADAEYTVLGDVKLDDLSGAEFYYAEGEQDEYNNGFYFGMEVTVFSTEYETYAETPIDFQGSVTYKGMVGEIEYGVFTAYVEDYTTFHVNVATDTPESLRHAIEISAREGDQLNKVHLVANGSKLAVDATASLPDLTVTSGEGAANLLQGGEAPHTLTVTNLTLDGKLSVGEDVTLKLDTQLSGTTPDLANLANAGGTVSVAMGNGDNVLTMDASSTGSLELRSGYISYRSELGEQALHLASGTQLWFGSNAGTKDDAVFTNDIVLDGNATVRVYGSSSHSSATISGNVTGDNYTLTKTDGNQNLIFSGVVNVGGLTTAGDGNGTIVFNGGEGSIGDIVTNGATKIRFSAGTTPGAKNTYSFDTFNIAPSNGERWLIVDENVTVHGTGSDLGNDNIHATINGGWNLNGGGLEVNGTLDLAGVISFDGPGNSSIKGAGIINTTGLNISNGTNTTVQGGVTINITSNTGIKKRAGSNSTLNLADATLTATTVDWELQNSVNSVNLTNASDGTTFEAAQGRTITLTKQMGGSGKLVKAGEGSMLVKGANTYSGGTSIDAGTLVAGNAGALGTGAVQIAQGANLVINAAMSNHTANSFNNSGGILTMQDGSSLTMHVTGGTRTFNLGNVVVNGSAGIAANTSSACYNALFNMTSLSSGSNGAEIVLATGAQYSKATVFDLDTNQTAAFNGTITVKQNNTSTSAGRPVALNLTIGEDAKAAEILKESVIKLDSAGNTNALVGLGLNSDVTVKGIDSGTAAAKQHAIFAGKATTDTATFASTGDDARTLTIDTAGTDHSTHADVLDKINLVKKGEGTQVFSGDMSQFHGSVDVEAGVLNIMNIAQATSLNVTDVTISNGTLGVYKGATATADTANEGTLTIKNAQSLTAKGTGAKLNANLVMDGGSTLDVSATGGTGLLMGSEVTLNMGVNLSTADLANVMGLMQGESYILFNGVDSLTLGQTTYTEAITPETKVDAAKWFNGLAAESYYVVYDGSNVGHVAIFSATPEPTTSTLSLLALAALAARRRRK